MDNPIYTHALRYAAEATKVWLMKQYHAEYPHYFDYAHIETRPATPDDYYIPPSLIQKCIVVERTYFEEIACLRLSCFPFKDNWEPCTENDSTQWVQIGENLELACQVACRDHSIHTDWFQNRCIVSNPLKKTFASMPEKMFDRTSRHIYHGGLNVVEGTLKLNAKYCEAYGLDFANDDCYQSGRQKFSEWMIGMTTTRAMRTAHIQPFVLQAPPVPNFFQYNAPPKKIRFSRSLRIEEDNDKAFQEIAESLMRDLGGNISQWTVQTSVRKKAPAFLTKRIHKMAQKLVLKFSVFSAIKSGASVAFKVLGKGFNVATAIFAVYDIIIAVIDGLDINNYTKVLDKATVDKINLQLDYHYFQDGKVRPELTPEYVWEQGILKEDQSFAYEYMTERVEEYLQAIRLAGPPSNLQKINLFVWKEEKRWNQTLFLGMAIVLIIFVFLYVEWIDLWVSGLFFLKVFFKL